MKKILSNPTTRHTYTIHHTSYLANGNGECETLRRQQTRQSLKHGVDKAGLTGIHYNNFLSDCLL
ncbi:hypothetical protein EON63_08870 [archaeon]|nr:MAG: hypothetical protein EON63_08870 [archaeon]